MADYYPLIAKAVSGLDKSTGEARRALYDRARTALLAQLRGVEPALSEPDITRERLALEEAIRKVEAEAARRSRSEPLAAAVRPESRQDDDPRANGTADPPEELPNPLPRYDLRASRPTIAPADDGDDRSDVEEAPQAVPLSHAAVKPAVDARQPDEPRIRTPRAPASGAEAPPLERAQWSRGGPSVSERGLKDFRDGIAGGGGALESATAPPAYPPAHAGEGREVTARAHPKTPDFERFEPGPGSRTEARVEPGVRRAPEQ